MFSDLPIINPSASSLQEILLTDIIHASELFQNNITSEELEIFVQDHQEKSIPFPAIIVERMDEKEYQLRFGALSFMGASISQEETIMAIVLEKPQEIQSTISDLNAFDWMHLDEIARAEAYHWLMERYQYSTTQLSHFIGKERSVISNQIRLLQLPLLVQKKIQYGKISKSHGLTLLRLNSPKKQISFAEKIETEMLTIRSLKQQIKDSLSSSSLSKDNQKISIHHNSTNMGHIRIPFSSKEDLQKLLQQLSSLCPAKKLQSI